MHALFEAARAPVAGEWRRSSVIIPARNEEGSIAATVRAVLAQATAEMEIEVIVVDDGSTDGTSRAAADAGARVLRLETVNGGNPAAARNRGAEIATGDPLIFLDADCTPQDGWLSALLAAHEAGAAAVGGALTLPPDLPSSARWDYYCTTYNLHPRRPSGPVENHSPANLSVRREIFLGTSGFVERLPVADGHEELAWQGELRRAGHVLWFEPQAVVSHRNRPGIRNLLRRSYRWGYSAIESKARSGAARYPWLYRRPELLIAAALPLAPLHALHTVACWGRVGVWEPLAAAPVVLASKVAYGLGMAIGGARWLARRGRDRPPLRPRWR